MKYLFLWIILISSCRNNAENPVNSPSSKEAKEKTSENYNKHKLIRIYNPEPHEKILLPYIIEGEARGNWYFEANFIIELQDVEGKVISTLIATAQGEWMTEDFVPFKALIKNNIKAKGKHFLVFRKANPSGLKENADEVKVMIEI